MKVLTLGVASVSWLFVTLEWYAEDRPRWWFWENGQGLSREVEW